MMKAGAFREILFRLIREHSNNTLPWPPKSEHDTVQYLAYAGRFLCPTYHFGWPQKDWLTSQEIKEFCQAFPSEWRGFNLDRHYNLLQLLKLIKNVPGETAECGVFEGASSYLILKHAPEYDNKKRNHYIFDSFEGLSDPGLHDGSHWKKGSLSCPEEYVINKLCAYMDRCYIYKGWIPSQFKHVESKIFSFVHIDVDLYEPTRDSIEFFYPRIVHGGILICDDFGFSSCPGATKAVNDFLSDKPEKMLGLAAGGGFFIRGIFSA